MYLYLHLYRYRYTSIHANPPTPPQPHPDKRLVNIAERQYLSLYTGEAKRKGGGLPNDKHPSDHLPIAVDVLLHLPSSYKCVP